MIKFKSKVLLGIVIAFVIVSFTSSMTYAVSLPGNKIPLTQKINQQYTDIFRTTLVLSAGDYTTTTWAAYISALDAAKDVENDFLPTQGEINNALTNLNHAKNSLVFAGQANLDAAKALAKTKKAADYTAASWKVLTDALAMKETTNAQMLAKTLEINNAISGLVFAGQANLDAAKLLVNGKNEVDYTVASWKVLTDALAMVELTNANVVAKTLAINNAINGLVFAGKANLDAAKLLVNGKNEVDYTAVSWKVLTDVLAMSEATNAEVVAKTLAINNAISGLVFAGQSDLDSAKARVVPKSSLDYTEGSWRALVNALAMPEVTNAEVVAKTLAINNAIGALVFAGQEDLDNVKLLANSKNEADYTVASWKVLSDALAMPESTNAEIVSKTLAINNAINGLVFAGQEGLDNAKLLANGKSEVDYTAASWKVLADALLMSEASNADVLAKTEAINNAIDALEFAGQEELDDAKLLANGKNEADYTVASWKYLTDALAMSEGTNTEVVAKTKAINDAINTLVFAGQEALSAAKTLANTKKQVDYTAETWKVLADALLMKETTNAEVIAKTLAINNAIKGLVFAGKANLDVAKVNASTKKQTIYTAESWKVLADALLMSESTNAEVVAKTLAINNAIAGLKIMPVQYRVLPYVGLNCRVSPNINSKKVLAYRYGNIIEITEIVNGWGLTRYGWVCMDYVTKFIPPVPLALKYKVAPYIGLNCRVAPDINSNKITAYKYGTMLEIFKIMNGWGNTNIGWVSMKYLKSI